MILVLDKQDIKFCPKFEFYAKFLDCNFRFALVDGSNIQKLRPYSLILVSSLHNYDLIFYIQNLNRFDYLVKKRNMKVLD